MVKGDETLREQVKAVINKDKNMGCGASKRAGDGVSIPGQAHGGSQERSAVPAALGAANEGAGKASGDKNGKQKEGRKG